MPVEPLISPNGWDYATDVGGDKPAPLGETPAADVTDTFTFRSDTFPSTWVPNGSCTHLVGFSQPIDTVGTLRLYFYLNDPDPDQRLPPDPKQQLPDFDLGYIQFIQLRSGGEPIPPEVVPALASRKWYAREDPPQPRTDQQRRKRPLPDQKTVDEHLGTDPDDNNPPVNPNAGDADDNNARSGDAESGESENTQKRQRDGTTDTSQQQSGDMDDFGAVGEPIESGNVNSTIPTHGTTDTSQHQSGDMDESQAVGEPVESGNINSIIIAQPIINNDDFRPSLSLHASSLQASNPPSEQGSNEPEWLFVEFMGPKDANIRFKGQNRIVPYYAMNAAARRDISYPDVVKVGAPCGSIRANQYQGDGATKASLRISLCPFLPDERLLDEFCGRSRDDAERLPFMEFVSREPDPVLELVPTDQTVPSLQQVNNQSFYQTVMTLLADDQFNNDRNKQITQESILDAQAVGSYLLLMLDDEFDYAVVLARMSSKGKIEIWIVDAETYPELEQEAVGRTADSIGEWFEKKDGPLPRRERVRQRRGMGGLREPHPVVTEKQPLLEMDLYSVVYASRLTIEKGTIFEATELIPVSGVLTRLSWVYDQRARQVRLQRSGPAQSVASLGQFNAALERYKRRFVAPPDDSVDTSHFLLTGVWADLAPPYQPQQKSTGTADDMADHK